MNKTLLFSVFILALTATGYAQSTTLTLPTADNTSNFTVTNSGSAAIMNLNGDAGFYLGGTFGTGTIPTSGAGVRLMWYPKKAAFRVGRVLADTWDDGYIGNFSIGLGYCINPSGESSTAIGRVALATGNYSTALGNYVSTNGMSGSFIIGDFSTTLSFMLSTAENQMTMRFVGGYSLYTSTSGLTGVLVAAGGNSWSSISDSTKKENVIKADGEYFLESLSKLKLGSWNYTTQNPAEYRHYGPMAQEIFHYFGKDELGVIGNDTTLASADMDGIMMICLQALEKRTAELKKLMKKIMFYRTK